MDDYQALYQTLGDVGAESWAQALPQQLANAFDVGAHGDLSRWLAVLATMPNAAASQRCLDSDAIEIGCREDLTAAAVAQLQQDLHCLHPWRKGPYRLFGIDVDTEWRSDWKWNRLKDHIAPLTRRLVLDVGCGNGYHCWRMLGAGARTVLGVDPMLLNVVQFHAVKRLYGRAPVYVLPFGIENVPRGLRIFDTVFSMGVLYHRRSPIDHLLELKENLRPGGELVLETLVVDGDADTVLLPEDRYARMRNVWFLPSCALLMRWLMRCGFVNVRLIDVTVTTVREQRSTAWMRFHSLVDFLDPKNPALTCEGLPAPKRAIVLANAV